MFVPIMEANFSMRFRFAERIGGILRMHWHSRLLFFMRFCVPEFVFLLLFDSEV